MQEITYEQVQDFLKHNNLELLPGQPAVSFPKIKRIYSRLKRGCVFSPIEVAGGRILDGHHRYVCLCLLGLEKNLKKAGTNLTYTTDFNWNEIILDVEDHDTPEERIYYENKYD
jgi:hypothetical protein